MELEPAQIIITTHYLTYGPSQALREYLLEQKNKTLLFVAHPLPNFNPQDRSYFELIEEGIIKGKKTTKLRMKNFTLNCLWELLLSFKWIVASKRKYDLFVGVDNLNAFMGLILRKLGFVKKVVYYVIDYFPTRFDNKILNFIYYKVDKLCVRYADETWNLSQNMMEAREKSQGMDREKYNRQKVVPVGVWFGKIERKSIAEIKKHQLVFVGHLLEMMGVQLVIKAIPLIVEKIPDFHFLIIGGGEYEVELKGLVKKMGLEKYVTFTGWIKDRNERDKLMADSACGVAPFNTEILDEKVRNADPAKIKDYLAMGMPVILTNAPSNAYEIEKNGCGIVIDYKVEDLVRAVVTLMKDENGLSRYRANALEYIKQYDWKLIFDYNLRRVLNIYD